MEKSKLKSKFLGAILGSAIGDAIGEMAFVYPMPSQGTFTKDLMRRVNATDQLVYTDDTAMAIGIAESLAEKRDLEEKHLGDTFAKNFNREPWRGYAGGPPTVFHLVASGITYRQAAETLFQGQGSLGNGAAMRIAPLAVFYYNSPELYHKVSVSAGITHVHPVGIDGAAVLTLAIARAVTVDPDQDFPVEKVMQELIDFAQTEVIKEKMFIVQTLLKQDISNEAAILPLGQGVAVQDSMPFAVYSFLRHWKCYRECLLCASMNGGDLDTLAAMACAISGAYHGIEKIPQEWRNKLENREYIEGLALKLAETAG